MATLTLDADELVPTLVLALQHPDVRRALGLDQRGDAPALAPRFLSPAMYAERLDVSQRTIRKWAARGLPVVRIGKVTRIPVDEADRWVLQGGTVRLAVAGTLRELALKRAGRR